jgi:tRNA (cytidine/uridine-2'-O-)-methyltransferase
MSIRLALYQPDIPQNAGALLRLAACCAVPLDIIEPCGFVWSDRRLRRAGMDYTELAHVTRHDSWEAFRKALPGRLLLLTTTGSKVHTQITFEEGDILLLGRESAGVPEAVHKAADIRLRIPIAENARSLNVAIAGAMVLGEALRQTNGFPGKGQLPHE